LGMSLETLSTCFCNSYICSTKELIIDVTSWDCRSILSMRRCSTAEICSWHVRSSWRCDIIRRLISAVSVFSSFVNCTRTFAELFSSFSLRF
jgi:hypothetical protein